MDKRVSAYTARTKFGEILDAVRYRKEPCVVERNGKPVAVIVDLEAYRSLEALREEERFIEEYSDERIQEFLAADRLPAGKGYKAKKVSRPAR